MFQSDNLDVVNFALSNKPKQASRNVHRIVAPPIDVFGISFAHASVRGHSTKQAFSAAKVAWEEYFFWGPSPGMFLFIPCLSQMTSEISHGSLLTTRPRTRLLPPPPPPPSVYTFFLLSLQDPVNQGCDTIWATHEPFAHRKLCQISILTLKKL